jgi:molecular chaperone HscB
MNHDSKQNYFELFGLPVEFQLDTRLLHDNHQKLQSAFHPDRFVNATDQERRIAVQQASMINQAYDTLHNPVQRARYMLRVAGVETNDSQTTQDASFLMEQIEMREELDQCRSCQDPMRCCDHITGKLEQRSAQYAHQFTELYSAGRYDEANQVSRKMLFVERVGEQIDEYQLEIEEKLF